MIPGHGSGDSNAANGGSNWLKGSGELFSDSKIDDSSGSRERGQCLSDEEITAAPDFIAAAGSNAAAAGSASPLRAPLLEGILLDAESECRMDAAEPEQQSPETTTTTVPAASTTAADEAALDSNSGGVKGKRKGKKKKDKKRRVDVNQSKERTLAPIKHRGKGRLLSRQGSSAFMNTSSEQVSDSKAGINLMNSKEKEIDRRSLLTADRGRWGQLRSLQNLRKVDVLEVATTSIKLSWDPSPTKPYKTVAFRISLQVVGRGGFLPIVEDTLLPHTTYCATGLLPDREYRFHIASLAQAPIDSRFAGQRLCIPKSSIRSKIIRTLPQKYESAWFFEEEKVGDVIFFFYNLPNLAHHENALSPASCPTNP